MFGLGYPPKKLVYPEKTLVSSPLIRPYFLGGVALGGVPYMPMRLLVDLLTSFCVFGSSRQLQKKVREKGRFLVGQMQKPITFRFVKLATGFWGMILDLGL